MSWLLDLVAPQPRTPGSPEQATEAAAMVGSDQVFSLLGDMESKVQELERLYDKEKKKAYASTKQLQATMDATNQLYSKIDRLEQQLLQAQAVIEQQQSRAFATFVERAGEPKTPQRSNEALQSAAAAARAAAATAAGSSPYPKSFYQHVVELEAKLQQERDRVEELLKEVAAGQQHRLQLEKELLKASQRQEERDRKGDPVRLKLEQTVAELIQERDRLVDELRAVNSSARAKSTALRDLTAKLVQSEGVAAERNEAESALRAQIQYTKQLEAKLTGLESRTRAQKLRISQLELEKNEKQAVGVPFEEWKADRARLTAAVRAAQAETKRLRSDLDGHQNLLREKVALLTRVTDAVHKREFNHVVILLTGGETRSRDSPAAKNTSAAGSPFRPSLSPSTHHHHHHQQKKSSSSSPIRSPSSIAAANSKKRLAMATTPVH